MAIQPRVLFVDTTYGPSDNWQDTINYHIYDHVPGWWRKIEKLLRMDLLLAAKVNAIADRYDVIVVGSEKAGLPLAFLNIHKPQVVHVHGNMSHPYRRILARICGIGTKWTYVGYVVKKDIDLMISDLNMSPERFYRCFSAPLDQFEPGERLSEGPILSIGVVKRDYGIVISALKELPGYSTEIYASSRYKVILKSSRPRSLPAWVQFETNANLSTEAVVNCYRRARFVVIPLLRSHHFGAGISAVCEALAAGKGVIASYNPGIVDYVVDGVTGILVPPGDVKALRQAIEKFWKDPELAYQMGLEGRKHAEKNFHPQKIWIEYQNAVLKAFQFFASNSIEFS